ncbi:MAG: dockerin type I domain-containing protein, partial [Patescibacteria group bacterium]
STRTGLTNGTLYYFVIVVNDFFGNRIATSTQVSATPSGSTTSTGGGGGGGMIIPKYVPPLDEELPECTQIADLNCDGYVDIVDFSIMYYWFDRNNPPKRVDLSKDGAVNIYDFSIMAYYWHERGEL